MLVRPSAPSRALDHPRTAATDRVRRSAALLLATALAAAGLVGVAARPAAATATTKVTTSLSLGPAKQTVPAGSTARLYARLMAGSRPLPNQSLSVWIMRPDRTWSYYASVKTNDNGQAGILRYAGANNILQARWQGNATFSGAASNWAYIYVSSTGARYVQEASRHAGKPYQWGAVGPSRFDCSGFTMYVFGRFGKKLPHNSGQQYGVTRHIAQSQKQVGDLIFISSGGRISHVGIYAGGNDMWASPKSGDVVKRQRIWSSSYYVGRVG